MEELQIKLKNLENKLVDKKLEAAGHTTALSHVSNDISRLRKEIREVKKSILHFNPEIQVTDHAIVRYLERVSGISRESIVAQILDESTSQKIKTAGGDGKYPNDTEEFTLVCQHYKVVTVLTSNERQF